MQQLVTKLPTQVQALVVREDGQALAQTGLIYGLVAAICLVALTAIGLAVSGNLFDFAMAAEGRSTSLIVN